MTHYSQKPDLFPMQGGCACGHLRYELSLPPLLVHCCHCTTCQRQVGSAFAINVVIEATAVKLLTLESPTSPASKAEPSCIPTAAMPVFASLTGGSLCAATVAESSASSAVTPKRITIPSESGVGQTVAQCPVCHLAVWNSYADAGSDLLYLRGGTLDHPYQIDPDVHIFTRSRRDFVTITDGKPQFEGYYGSRTPFYRPELQERLDVLRPKQAAFGENLKAAFAATMNKSAV